MGAFIPFSSFESRLFLARRLAGVPGYQYDIDMSKEVFQRQIFSSQEIQKVVKHFQMVPGHEYRRHMVFDAKMYLLDINRIDDLKGENESTELLLDNMDVNRNIFGHYTTIIDNNNNGKAQHFDEDIAYLMEYLELKHPSELSITQVDEENIGMYMNDRKFKQLSSKDQLFVKIGIHQINMIGNRFVRPLYEAGLSMNLFLMGLYQNKQK